MLPQKHISGRNKPLLVSPNIVYVDPGLPSKSPQSSEAYRHVKLYLGVCTKSYRSTMGAWLALQRS